MSEIREFDAGDIIFKQGDLEMFMYSIIAGKVGIYGNFGTPSETLYTSMDKGVFGEMGLIDASVRSATAVALTYTRLEKIDAKQLKEYFYSNPGFAIRMLQTLSNRLRKTDLEYMEACRTISDYLEAERKHEDKEKSGLMSRMRKFADRCKSK